jgi:hypothetical protein
MRSAGIDARSGALGKRFDAYPWRHPVTESSYINSLANRPYRSTVKTLPATLPEPWAVVRGQCLAVKASWLLPLGRQTGVTGADCEIWIDLGQGVGAYVRVVDYSGLGRVMEGWRQ